MPHQDNHHREHAHETPAQPTLQTHGYTPSKEQYLARLGRIEGQVRGLARMVEQDTYCIDVITQVAAVQSALRAVALGLVEDHMGHCVVHAARESDEAAAAKVHEAAVAIGRLAKS